jgi:hypothetical protein
MTTYAILLLITSPVGIMGLLWGIAHYEGALLRARSRHECSGESGPAGPRLTDPARQVAKPAPVASDV